jgi:hypothetical protein
MDLVAELQRLEHQLELADRMLATVRDQPTIVRLLAFGEDIKARIDRLKPAILEDATRRHAYRLWEDAGRSAGRDTDFWLGRAAGQKRAPSVTPSPNLATMIGPPIRLSL